MNLKYLFSREGVARIMAERRMNILGIDNSPKLRDDLFYLWRHGYETVLSCGGHCGTSTREENRKLGISPYVDVIELPYIQYVKGTGDGSWENGEGEMRGWHFKGESVSRPDLFYDREQYEPLVRKCGAEFTTLGWVQDEPLQR